LVLSTLIRTTLRKFMDAMAQAACMVDSAVNRDELWVQSRSGASDSIRKGKRRSWLRVGKRAGQS
jgi:hypothetical protein